MLRNSCQGSRVVFYFPQALEGSKWVEKKKEALLNFEFFKVQYHGPILTVLLFFSSKNSQGKLILNTKNNFSVIIKPKAISGTLIIIEILFYFVYFVYFQYKVLKRYFNGQDLPSSEFPVCWFFRETFYITGSVLYTLRTVFLQKNSRVVEEN